MKSEKVIKAGWQGWHNNSEEELTLQETSEGIFVESAITSRRDEKFIAKYTITCDTAWRVREFNMELAGTQNKLRLESDGQGNWLANSNPLPELKGAIDIDISATPFTNTLPIRRLKLGEGESVKISTVYVSVPDLEIFPDPQRYTCLIPNKRYRYESLDSDFVREIDIDKYGLVMLYPGLFRRIH